MKKATLLILSTLFILSAAAQNDPDKLSLDSGEIDQQFEYIFTKSANWQIYKTVKKTELKKLRNNVKDSISAMKEKLAQANNTIASKENDYKSLQGKLDKTKSQLDKVTKSQNNISLLGMSLSKSNFKTLFWLIISLLSLVLLYFIYSYKNSNKITKDTLNNYANLEEEFNSARTRALEREQVLSRKLLDEQNKSK